MVFVPEENYSINSTWISQGIGNLCVQLIIAYKMLAIF